MNRTIALQSEMDDIAAVLKKRGFHVVDMLQASKPGLHIDAFLFTSNHPDIVTSFNSYEAAGNISLRDESPSRPSGNHFVMLNVTGMTASDAVDELEKRLASTQR